MRCAAAPLVVITLFAWGCSSGTETKVTITPEEIARRSEIAASAEQQLDDLAQQIAEGRQAPWEGEYYLGDGTGVNISFGLSRTSGAAYVWRGCLGTYGAGTGAVRESGDLLEISFDRQFGMMWKGSERLYPVQWGERHYLIPPEEMKDFCSDIDGGQEPRAASWGLHLLRRGDELLPATGKPRLPPQFQTMISADSRR